MQVDLKFRNLEVKRFNGPTEGPVNVHNNSTLKGVSKIEGKLSIDFAFTCTYEPGIGLIRIDGDIILHDSEENIERALKEWEKNPVGGGRNLPTDIAEKVHNAILSGCMVESVILSKEVGLPAPMPTPTISLTKKDDKVAKSDVDTRNYIR